MRINAMESVYEWLLTGPACVEYRTRVDLLGQHVTAPEVIASRRRMLADPLVSGLIAELASWPGHVLNSHKSASQQFHKLNFLVDIGITAADEGMHLVVDRILAHQSEEGPFQLPTQIPEHFGGSGEETGAWALCDAPLILYALSKLGYGEDARVRKGVEYLVRLCRENGWPCTVSRELGKFRGPGRKDDPCPYATLAMLKLMSLDSRDKTSIEAKYGVETLLNLWEHRQEQHPYIFYMGTDFSKLKVPLVWYDLLHVLEVLTHYPDFRNDPRLQNMLGVLKSKADSDGRFTLESVWTAWKDWEFEQKKVPSFWLTFLAIRMIKRSGMSD
jgi:hypothetical protein